MSTVNRVAILFLLLVTLAPAAPAQQRIIPSDSTSRFRVVEPTLRVEDPVVLALVDSGDVPKFDLPKQVAESLGYHFLVRKAAGLQLQDPRYSAVYYLPDGLKRGFVIMMPGRRPVVIQRYVTADSLRTRITDYERLHRDLTPGL